MKTSNLIGMIIGLFLAIVATNGCEKEPLPQEVTLEVSELTCDLERNRIRTKVECEGDPELWLHIYIEGKFVIRFGPSKECISGIITHSKFTEGTLIDLLVTEGHGAYTYEECQEIAIASGFEMIDCR